jgi:general secretion pathway protein A
VEREKKTMLRVPKILIVDDDKTVCNSLKEFLADNYPDVRLAFGGTDAVRLLAEENFDLVLLDLLMPDMSGGEVMDFINREKLDVFVVVITGDPSREAAVAALRKGAYAYLQKPFNLEDLLSAVANVLRLKRLEDEGKRLEKELELAAPELGKQAQERSAELAAGQQGVFRQAQTPTCEVNGRAHHAGDTCKPLLHGESVQESDKEGIKHSGEDLSKILVGHEECQESRLLSVTDNDSGIKEGKVERFYSLVEKPFQLSPDPRFLWLGESHQQALAALKRAILDNQGFLVLTGDVGTGKTTLINALLNRLGSDTLVASIPNPCLEVSEFPKAIANACNYHDESLTSRLKFLSWFRALLKNAHVKRLKVLLIIDEAQKLSLELLEKISLLSNTDGPEAKVFNVLFVGQSEFNDILRSEHCKCLRQRIRINHTLRALTSDETKEYVRHRLRLAGAKRGIFTSESIKEVYLLSRGYPRLINILCDRALLTGYARKLETISSAVVKHCGRELTLPGELRENLRDQEGSTQKRWRFGRTLQLAMYGGLLISVLAVFGYLLPVLGSRSGLWADLADFASGVKTSIEHVGRASNSEARDPSVDGTRVDAAAVSGSSAETGASVPRPEGRTSNPSLPDPGQGKTAAEVELSDPFGDSRLVIAFAYRAVTLSGEASAKLDEVARYMVQKPELVVAIKGYTDAHGNANYNQTISEFRANVVKTYLAGKGVSLQRMTTAGLGSANPVMPNTTEEGRRANRRVEIEPTESGRGAP